MATVAYMRMSTAGQDGKAQRQAILEWAAKTGTRVDSWAEETISSRKADRQIVEIIESLQPGDTLVTAELSRLARSMGELFGLIQSIRQRGARVVLAGEDRTIEPEETIEGNAWLFAVSIGAQIERQMISERTKAALRERKAAGVKLGRPRGPGKSKLDPHAEEIRGLLGLGVPKSKIAEKYGVTPATVGRWCTTHGVA